MPKAVTNIIPSVVTINGEPQPKVQLCPDTRH